MSAPVHIPVDVDVEDRIVGPLTARQLVILAVGALPLWVLWSVRDHIGLIGFATAAVPITILTALFAFARLEGVGVDRLALAAARERLTHPTVRRSERHDDNRHDHDRDDEVGRGSGGAVRWLRPVRAPGPVWGVHDTGASATGEVAVVEIASPTGTRGEALAVIAEVAPVNLALRSPAEQEVLVAGFARWLHSLSAGVQILTRTHHVDLHAHLARLDRDARALPRALRDAARAHARHLHQRATQVDLLERRTYIVIAEPAASSTRSAVEHRLRHRLGEARDLLGAAGITVEALDPARVDAVLRTALTGDHTPTQHLDTDRGHSPAPPAAVAAGDPPTEPLPIPVPNRGPEPAAPGQGRASTGGS